MRTTKNATACKIKGKEVKETENGKPIYEITTEIKVQIIDWKKAIEKILESVEDIGEDKYKNIYNQGIIYSKENLPMLIDNECVGWNVEEKNIFVNNEISRKKLTTIGFWKEHKKQEDGTQTISVFPSFEIEVDFDFIKDFVIEKKELWEFMEDRYLYNPRIENNLNEICKWYKGEIK